MSIKKFDHLDVLRPIIHGKANDDVQSFLVDSLNHFYGELDFFIEQNGVDGIEDYFLERSYLSMFINGIIRNDINKDISVVQEYGLRDLSGKDGRCDAFLNFKQNNIFYIESKLQKLEKKLRNDHWDIDSWLAWDDIEIRSQLINYFEADKKYMIKKPNRNYYLMTMVFKIVKQNCEKHFKNATDKLSVTHEHGFDWDWYYSGGFINNPDDEENIGIEVYGTIEKKVIQSSERTSE